MRIKNFTIVALIAFLVSIAMMPMGASATQTASVEYTGGNGDPITHLNLIADDSNLANNHDAEWNKANAKVQVPVAINYVARADGTVDGPAGGTVAEGKASITNYSVFPVHVTNIAVTQTTGVSIDTTAPTLPDHLQLFVKPGNGTLDQLGNYTANGGSRPTVPTDWNIEAGLDETNGTSLALNNLGGSIGGFATIDPSTSTEIGQVNWTIKAGTYELGDLTLSPRSHGSAAVSASSTSIDESPLYVGDTAYVFVTPETGYSVAGVEISTLGGETFNATQVNTSGVGGQSVSATAIQNDPMDASAIANAEVYSFTVPSGELTVNVMFAQGSYNISAPSVQNGSFAVKTDPSDSETISAAGYGETIYIVTTPDSGYMLSSVTVTPHSGGAALETQTEGNTVSFTMPAEAVDIAVSFTQSTFTVTKNATVYGSFRVGLTSDATSDISTAQCGSTVYVIATPSNGYQLSSITVSGSTATPSVDISGNVGSFTMPDEAVSVSVSFGRASYSIMKGTSSNGSFYVGSSAMPISDISTAQYGDTVYIGASPNTGYAIESATITGARSHAETKITMNGNNGSFTMPAEAITVNVTFKFSMSANYTMKQLQTISADISEKGSSSTYYSTFNNFARNGETVQVTLANQTTTRATLVDASAGYGLVFMLDPLPVKSAINSTDTSTGGWAASEVRTKLQSGTLFSTYLDGMTMHLMDATDQVVTPATVTTYSSEFDVANFVRKEQTAQDTFFLASITEIYAPTSSKQTSNSWTNGAQYEPHGHQFAYFNALGVTGSQYNALSCYNTSDGWGNKANNSTWWLRSTGTNNIDAFWNVDITGNPIGSIRATGKYTILPCFSLAAPSAPTINASMFSNSDLEGLKEVANYITSAPGNADTTYINNVKSFIGSQMRVGVNSLYTGISSIDVRLVHVDTTRGLTFESIGTMVNGPMNNSRSNSGGWASSALRTSMNTGAIYELYFEGTDLDGYVRAVNNTSYSYGGGTNTSQLDKYWIASMNNIYGSGWNNNASYDDGDAQFTYYANITNPPLDSQAYEDSRLIKYLNNNGSNAQNWWIRSADPSTSTRFMTMYNDGMCGNYYGTADSALQIAPCFCL